MLQNRFSFLFVAFVLFFSHQVLHAQSVRFSGTIRDKVSNETLPGALVYIHETGKNSAADANGLFVLENLKPGIYHIHVQMTGYEPYAQNFSILKDTLVEILLEPTAIELKNFTVEADLLRTDEVKNALSTETANKEYLNKQSANTFSNTLERIPGISAMNVGVGIAKPVIRGMSFNRVSVTENGIKQEGQQWGADHGLELDQFNVERVEILKGPSSLLYGSDAMAGVINILPPLIPLEGKWNTEVLGLYRSNNNAVGSSVMTEFNKKRNFFRLRATWQEYGDYKVPADTFLYNTYVLPIYKQRLKNTAGKELNFSASGGIMRDWGMMRLTFTSYNQQAGLFPGATGIPRAYTLTEDGDSRNIALPRQVNHHYKVLYNINIRRKKGWFETDLGYQYNIRMEQSNPHAHGYTPLTLSDTALYLGLQTFSFNTRIHHQPVPRFKSVVGLSGQHMDNTKAGFEFLIPNYRSTTAGAYYFMQVYLNEDFTISAGLRGDAAHLKMDGWDQPNYDVNGEITGYTHRSPIIDKWFANVSGAAGFSWEIKHEFNIKLNLGRSFRTPTPAELGANGIHHGTFRHEMGDSTLRSEIGYQSDLAFIYHDEHYLIRFTPFYNYFDNYIFLRPAAEFSPLPDAGQIYRYTQARAIHTGFELYGEYHIIPELHLETGIEYVWNLNLDTWLPLPFTPPGSAMLGIEWEKEREKKKLDSWFIGADGFYYLAQNRVDRNEKSTPGYFLLSASFGMHVTLHKHFAFDILLKGNNLLNTEYMNHLSRYRLLNLPEQGRNFSIMLRMNF